MDMGIHLMLPVTDRQCLADLHRRVHAPEGRSMVLTVGPPPWLSDVSPPGGHRHWSGLKGVAPCSILFVPHARVARSDHRATQLLLSKRFSSQVTRACRHHVREAFLSSPRCRRTPHGRARRSLVQRRACRRRCPRRSFAPTCARPYPRGGGATIRARSQRQARSGGPHSPVPVQLLPPREIRPSDSDLLDGTRRPHCQGRSPQERWAYS